MKPALGFSAFQYATEDQVERGSQAKNRALAPFSNIQQHSIRIGSTLLELWGRAGKEECTYTLPDGSLLVLVGSPIGHLSWNLVEKEMMGSEQVSDFRLPWDGRVILLHISPEGDTWTIWNDWIGSIPVFYSSSSESRIASTLEPVVVAVNQFTQEDFFLPGVVLMLSHGNLLFDWTIYRSMYTIKPDSVTIFGAGSIKRFACDTVLASDERWEAGWQDMIDEMHMLVSEAVMETLKTQPAWTIPLSSGLDSRLIAAIAAESGVQANTYTWGSSDMSDVVFSRQIARILGFSWQQVDLGNDYLCRCLPTWVNLFGSSMHLHGMYQIPFIEMIQQIGGSPIASGFIGECMAGYDVRFLSEHHLPGKRVYYAVPEDFIFWKNDELKNLFLFSIDEALEEIADEIEVEKKKISGPWFDRLRFLTLWGRQNHFTYFQSMLSDYACGVGTPYLYRLYARFCFSLPRSVLDDRRLQIDMMRRYYPKVMRIPGTFSHEPALFTGKYFLRKRLANTLPSQASSVLFPEFFTARNIQTDVVSLKKCGEQAIWPIREAKNVLEDWINLGEIEKTYQNAKNGDFLSVRKLQSIQALAFRLLE